MSPRLLATTAIVLGAIICGATTLPARAALISKTFEFRDRVTLEIGSATEDGIRVDSVRFQLPATAGGKHFRTGGLVEAVVALSNTTAEGKKIAVAIALFDDQGQLVGVASGGSRMVGLKPGRQKTYKLIFDHLNGEAFRATTFQISVESKP